MDVGRGSYIAASFEILNIYDTEYQGTLNPLPKALFGIMRKRKTNP